MSKWKINQRIIRLVPWITKRDTKSLLEKLKTAGTVVLDDGLVYFIFEDEKEIIVPYFECQVLLAHQLGLEIDWPATF
jgi:hypothetical protein